MRESQALKAQMDVARQKEERMKDRIQPWINEAFIISTMMEGRIA